MKTGWEQAGLHSGEFPPGALVGLRLDWQTTPNWGVFLGVDNLTDTALATDQTADHIHVYDEPRVFRFGFRIKG